jgi:hypothetical protein
MGLTGIATTIQDFMKAGPGPLWTLVCLVLVFIPVALLHELGHAAMARARLGSEVHVRIGGVGRIGTFRLGRLIVTLNAFEVPWRLAGLAMFDARQATARDILWIALAGPAASLVGLVILVIGYRHAPASGAIHALLWAAVAESVFAVAPLIPLRLRERRGGPAINTDGMIALSALTNMFARGSRQPRSPDNPHRPTQQAERDSAALDIRVLAT